MSTYVTRTNTAKMKESMYDSSDLIRHIYIYIYYK